MLAYADAEISSETDKLLFESTVPDGQQGDNSWMLAWDEPDSTVEELLAEFYELPSGAVPGVQAAVGGEADSEMALEEAEGLEESGEDEGKNSGPTAEELARWQSAVVSGRSEPTGNEQASGRFQGRCFAVEWRGSVLLDKGQFVRQLFRALGKEGEEASFVLGMEVRKSRADYFLVVRLKTRLRWRDWRKKLMFGHGGEVEGEGLFMRVRVPCRSSEEGTKAFVEEMIGKGASLLL